MWRIRMARIVAALMAALVVAAILTLAYVRGVYYGGSQNYEADHERGSAALAALAGGVDR